MVKCFVRKYRQTLRIVTIEGDLITPGGAMTGGAFKNSSNLLSRRREIELEKTVCRLKDEMIETETALNASKQKRTESYGMLKQVKDQLQEFYVKQNTAKMNLEQAKSQRVTAKGEVKSSFIGRSLIKNVTTDKRNPGESEFNSGRT